MTSLANDSLDYLSRVGGLHVLDELRVILADEGLLVITCNVMPHHTVAVEVVQHGQAGLIIFALKIILNVID